jgi:hypothetical protein
MSGRRLFLVLLLFLSLLIDFGGRKTRVTRRPSADSGAARESSPAFRTLRVQRLRAVNSYRRRFSQEGRWASNRRTDRQSPTGSARSEARRYCAPSGTTPTSRATADAATGNRALPGHRTALAINSHKAVSPGIKRQPMLPIFQLRIMTSGMHSTAVSQSPGG